VFLLSLSLSLSLAKLLSRKEMGFRFTVGEAKTQNLPASRNKQTKSSGVQKQPNQTLPHPGTPNQLQKGNCEARKFYKGKCHKNQQQKLVELQNPQGETWTCNQELQLLVH
jgi:hypothetical protein